jgi:hypothetical protein
MTLPDGCTVQLAERGDKWGCAGPRWLEAGVPFPHHPRWLPPGPPPVDSELLLLHRASGGGLCNTHHAWLPHAIWKIQNRMRLLLALVASLKPGRLQYTAHKPKRICGQTSLRRFFRSTAIVPACAARSPASFVGGQVQH